jgi:hypothetical protein
VSCCGKSRTQARFAELRVIRGVPGAAIRSRPLRFG